MQKERYSFRLSERSIDFLKKQASKYGMSISAYLNTLLESLSARSKNENKKTHIND